VKTIAQQVRRVPVRWKRRCGLSMQDALRKQILEAKKRAFDRSAHAGQILSVVRLK
jgi:hypothetical protein